MKAKQPGTKGYESLEAADTADKVKSKLPVLQAIPPKT